MLALGSIKRPSPSHAPFRSFSSLIPLFYFSEADEGFDIGFRRRGAAAAAGSGGRGGGCSGGEGGGRRPRRSRIIGGSLREEPAASGEEVPQTAEQNARTAPDVQNVVPEFFDLQVLPSTFA